MHRSTIAALMIVILAAWTLTACRAADPSFKGTVLDPPRPVQDFTLTAQDGQTFHLSAQRGRVVLLFFGYTSCPDVCPTTLATWKRVQAALGKDAERVRFVFITVDPERDTPERLRQHLELFSRDFIGLTGKLYELEAVYQAFGVYYEKDVATESTAGYLVNHTASVFLVDPDGRWRLLYNFGASAEDILHDIRELLK